MLAVVLQSNCAHFWGVSDVNLHPFVLWGSQFARTPLMSVKRHEERVAALLLLKVERKVLVFFLLAAFAQEPWHPFGKLLVASCQEALL